MTARRSSLGMRMHAIVLAGLLAACCCAPAVGVGGAAQPEEPDLPPTPPPGPVDVLDIPISTSHLTEEDIQPLLRENLDVDMQYWRQRTRAAPLTVDGVLKFKKQLWDMGFDWLDTLKIILIYNNTLYFPDGDNHNHRDMTRCPDPCNFHMQAYKVLKSALERGRIHLPNTLFVWDVNDNARRFCRPENDCSAPLLSLFKFANGTDADSDILVPLLAPTWVERAMHYYPWELKGDRAFFRGVPSCQGYQARFEHSCPRTYLALLSRTNSSAVLDVGLTEKFVPERDERTGEISNVYVKTTIPPVKGANIREHAKHKYLLQMDGITASGRLAGLLHCNSIVLKSWSPYLEYFYRSLVPGQHYELFWDREMNDVFPLLEALRRDAEERPERIHARIRRTMQFALRYLTHRPRLLYWQAALRAYRSLFDANHDDDIEALVAKLRAKGMCFTRCTPPDENDF